jgi:hypothetical protein
MTPAYLLPAPPPRQSPAQALHALAGQLRQRGITSLYGNACDQLGVLSLPGVSVWTNGRILWWRTSNGTQTTWPAADPEGAARLLATPTTGPGAPPPQDGP